MHMLITYIRSPSIQIRRRTFPPTICESICGISILATKVLVGVHLRICGGVNWQRCLTDIVDIKPVNMEELTEVITATEFHPFHCNLFMYSSSKSSIKLADMRDSALCDKHAKCMLSFDLLAPV